MTRAGMRRRGEWAGGRPWAASTWSARGDRVEPTGRHTGRTDLPLEPPGAARQRRSGALVAGRSFALVLTSPLARARRDLRPGRVRRRGRGDPRPGRVGLRAVRGADHRRRSARSAPAGRCGSTGWPGARPRPRSGAGPTGSSSGPGPPRATPCASPTVICCGCWPPGGWAFPRPAAACSALDAGSLSVLGWEREVPVVEPMERAAPARVTPGDRGRSPPGRASPCRPG